MGRIEEIKSQRKELQAKLREIELEERDLTLKEVFGNYVGKYIKTGIGVYHTYLKVSTQDVVVDSNNCASCLLLRGPGFSRFHTAKQITYTFDSGLSVSLIRGAKNELIELSSEEFKKELDKAIKSSTSIFKYLENE